VSFALWGTIAWRGGWWRSKRPDVLRATLAVNLVLASLLVVTIALVIHGELLN